MSRWRPPTRPLTLIALLLLAGAVVNVGVAWAIAAWSRTLYPESVLIDRLPAWIQREPGVENHTKVWNGRLWRRATVFYYVDSLVWIQLTTAETGWPFKSMRAVTRYRENVLNRGPLDTDSMFGGLRKPPGSISAVGIPAPEAEAAGRFDVTDRLIPVVPVLPGFAINTLFYAALLALPLSVFPIRRRLRARRGRCPKCGYDRTGLNDPAAPCPECGATR